MKTGNLTQLTRKLTVITSIIGATAFFGVPAIAQTTTETQTPGANDTTTPPATSPSPVPTNEAVPPATQQQAPGSTTGAASGNIVEVASTSGSFNTLAQAVEAAGLANTLADGSYTIFAPTDQAFQTSLPEGAVPFLLQPENRDLLRQVLTYHVVPREVTANQLRTGSVKTLGGGVAVRVTPERVVVNDASVVQSNIEAENGVIHAVNRVLLPTQLRQTIASRLESQPQNQTPQQNQAPQ
jgi:uncharacterized surface protein with fasciclin (FAS1) repeats